MMLISEITDAGGGATQVRPAELQADCNSGTCDSSGTSSDHESGSNRDSPSVAEDTLAAVGVHHAARHRQPQLLVPSVGSSWDSSLQEPTAAAAAEPTAAVTAAAAAEAQQLEAQRGAIEAQLASAQQLAQAQLAEAARAAAAEAQAASEAQEAAAARAAARVGRPLFEEAALTLAIAQVRLARLPASERGTSTLLNEVSEESSGPSSSPTPNLWPYPNPIP